MRSSAPCSAAARFTPQTRTRCSAYEQRAYVRPCERIDADRWPASCHMSSWGREDAARLSCSSITHRMRRQRKEERIWYGGNRLQT